MRESQLALLMSIRTISRISVLMGLIVAIILQQLFPSELNWQVIVALAALTVGIPHGAVDHLIAIPKLLSIKMAIFIGNYLLVTGIAIWFLLTFPLFGFQVVVVFSALHFGVGDASFFKEIYRRSDQAHFPGLLYAIPAGFTPVVIPLANSQTNSALETVNPELVGWAGSWTHQLLVGAIVLNLSAVVILLVRKLMWPAVDLLVLLSVALLAPPLVAFALYFGLWHAMRHTVRLTLEYEPSIRLHEIQKPWRSFWVAVRAGLPAVVIVVGFSIGLAFTGKASVSTNLLWYLLVVTWALTVPHMALTAKSDVKAMQPDFVKV